MLLLLAVRARTDVPAASNAPADGTPSASSDPPATRAVRRTPLPAMFHWFAAAMALCTAGLVAFGLIGFHLVRAGVVATATVPLMYAAAMAAGAIAALLTGALYDRIGPRVLIALPALIAAVPALLFGGGLPLAAAGVLLWGAAVGVQDSTVKALVADLVPRERRATAYGVFAAVQGAGALAGGAAAGFLYEFSPASLTTAVAITQVIALVTLVGVLTRLATR